MDSGQAGFPLPGSKEKGSETRYVVAMGRCGHGRQHHRGRQVSLPEIYGDPQAGYDCPLLLRKEKVQMYRSRNQVSSKARVLLGMRAPRTQAHPKNGG